MKTAVIGSGLAGLAAARTLASAGLSVKVFEARDKIGGRVETMKLGPFVFDPGATSIAPMGQALERVILDELPQDDLVRITKPVVAHDGFRPVSGSVMAANTPRYNYGAGIEVLPALLSEGLDIRLSTPVDRVKASGEQYEVAGNVFDAVIVAVPTPDAQVLLQGLGEARRLSNLRYRSCISVLLGYDAPFEAPYHALVGPDQAHPLAWLSLESVKCPGTRAPEGSTAVVAQLSSEYSKRRYAMDDELIIEETAGDVGRLMGKAFSKPVVSQVVRYRNSHPESTTSFDVVNSPMSRLVLAGDGLLGGRTELAFETGLRAARLLMSHK
ncbi:MAG: FAD-dependent oxidoreductase [Armatimonadetes bacterium]|nr:FAD-dependent oxidoreductase [Armatimonadota bacterium]